MNWVKQRKAWAGTCTPSEHDWDLALSWAGARSAQDYELLAGAAYSAIVEGVECATLAFDDVGLSVPCNQSLYLVGGSGPCLCVPVNLITGEPAIGAVLELLHPKIKELDGEPEGCLYLGVWSPKNADVVYFDIASGTLRYDHAVSTMMARSSEEALFDIKEGKSVWRKDALDTLLAADREKGLEAYRQWQRTRHKGIVVNEQGLLHRNEVGVSQLKGAAMDPSEKGLSPIGPALKAVLSDAKAVAESGQKGFGIRTGFSELDRIVQGFRPGEFVVISSAPSIREAALLRNIVLGTAKSGAPVVYCSREHDSNQLAARLMSIHSGIPLLSIQQGALSEGEWQTLSDSAQYLGNLNLSLLDGVLVSRGRVEGLLEDGGIARGSLLVFDSPLVEIDGVDPGRLDRIWWYRSLARRYGVVVAVGVEKEIGHHDWSWAKEYTRYADLVLRAGLALAKASAPEKHLVYVNVSVNEHGDTGRFLLECTPQCGSLSDYPLALDREEGCEDVAYEDLEQLIERWSNL